MESVTFFLIKKIARLTPLLLILLVVLETSVVYDLADGFGAARRLLMAEAGAAVIREIFHTQRGPRSATAPKEPSITDSTTSTHSGMSFDALTYTTSNC